MTNPANNYPPYGPPPYYLPGNPAGLPPFATIFPPPIMGLAKAYLTERMNPVPVATRLPQPANTADTVNGFIRIEPDGGAVMLDDLLFNCGIIVHSYAPHNQDSQAEINLMHCLAHLGAAQGRYIVHPSLQRPWFCTYSRITSLAISQPDPAVNLTRLRGAATWRIKGTSDPLNETSPVE